MTPTKKECCPACMDTDGFGADYGCLNKFCPCHQETTGWEKEFDRLGGEEVLEDYDEVPLPEEHLTRGFNWPETKRELDPEKVKSFIHQLLERKAEAVEGIQSVPNPNKLIPKDVMAEIKARNKALREAAKIIRSTV